MSFLFNNHKIPSAIIAQAKATIEENEGRTPTEDEVTEMLKLMYSLANISIEQVKKELDRKKKLQEFPKGFALDHGGTCKLCGKGTDLSDSWFDRYGIKCLACQKAMDTGLIPDRIFGKENSFYTDCDLEKHFNLKGKELGEWIKAGLIKARIIPNLNGKGKHFRLFLMSDNKGFLPPLKMLEEGKYEVSEIEGRKFTEYVYWYQQKDPLAYLKKYGIVKYLEIAEPEHEKLIKESPQQPEPEREIQVSYCAPCNYPAPLKDQKRLLKRKAKRKH
nr:hypothetical protein [Pedobacter panaciterrae]